MSDPAFTLNVAEPDPPVFRARAALLKRLTDVVCLPGSRINSFERAVTGDLLFEMLREAPTEERRRVASRLAGLTELPSAVTRLLLRDDPAVAGLLIAGCPALTDSDLVASVKGASSEHQRMIAARKDIGEVVSDTLIATKDIDVILELLRNASARLTQPGIETVVGLSRMHKSLCQPLLRRPEMRPSSAYVMFWWCDAQDRKLVLQRFAVSREVMQDVAEDVFAMAAQENWQDPVARKALQFIERRQRNRAAMAKSPFGGLEQAVEAASETGLSPELAGEIAHMCGVKPLTGAKIMGDQGGEPLAILCKATGMTKLNMRQLWRSLRRLEALPNGEPNPAWAHVLVTYDMLAVDRAQTVLRYWNWSLSSAMTPELLQAIRDGEEEQMEDYSTPERAAILALAADFGRGG